MTSEQIWWASLHDWFIRDNKDGSIDVLESWSDGREIVRSFGDFPALRTWAGY